MEGRPKGSSEKATSSPDEAVQLLIHKVTSWSPSPGRVELGVSGMRTRTASVSLSGGVHEGGAVERVEQVESVMSLGLYQPQHCDRVTQPLFLHTTTIPTTAAHFQPASRYVISRLPVVTLGKLEYTPVAAGTCYQNRTTARSSCSSTALWLIRATCEGIYVFFIHSQPHLMLPRSGFCPWPSRYHSTTPSRRTRTIKQSRSPGACSYIDVYLYL